MFLMTLSLGETLLLKDFSHSSSSVPSPVLKMFDRKLCGVGVLSISNHLIKHQTCIANAQHTYYITRELDFYLSVDQAVVNTIFFSEINFLRLINA